MAVPSVAGRLLEVGASDMICSIDGCDDPARARGWCTKHYQRWQASGDSGVPRGDLAVRFGVSRTTVARIVRGESWATNAPALKENAA